MCGIAGILNFRNNNNGDNNTLLKQRLQSMNNALQHRGPDGEGIWVNEEGSVALGHRRLSIIDLSNAGHQPMHYVSKNESYNHRYTITHNGEIYNYIELREELAKHGYTFQSHTDTEVIVAAYDFWKDLCVDHFDGMFAFAIWDAKEKELFAARDRFGEKPFFYYFDKNQFLFASEMKAYGLPEFTVFQIRKCFSILLLSDTPITQTNQVKLFLKIFINFPQPLV